MCNPEPWPTNLVALEALVAVSGAASCSEAGQEEGLEECLEGDLEAGLVAACVVGHQVALAVVAVGTSLEATQVEALQWEI